MTGRGCASWMAGTRPILPTGVRRANAAAAEGQPTGRRRTRAGEEAHRTLPKRVGAELSGKGEETARFLYRQGCPRSITSRTPCSKKNTADALPRTPTRWSSGSSETCQSKFPCLHTRSAPSANRARAGDCGAAQWLRPPRGGPGALELAAGRDVCAKSAATVLFRCTRPSARWVTRRRTSCGSEALRPRS